MLSKSMFAQNKMLTSLAFRGFSSIPEYDVAVIGGGPGGKLVRLILLTLSGM